MATEIVHCQTLSRALGIRVDSNKTYRYANFGENRKDVGLKLKEIGFQEVDLKNHNDSEVVRLEKQHLDNIALLSADYSSISWWANCASEKNEHLSLLYNNVVQYCSLINAIKQSRFADMVFVVACNHDIYCQLRGYSRKNQIKFKSLDNVAFTQVAHIGKALSVALSVVRTVIRSMLNVYYVSRAYRKYSYDSMTKDDDCYVLRTWYNSSFVSNWNRFYDAYFGCLPKRVAERGRKLVLIVGVISDYKKALADFKSCANVQIFPEEYFLRLSDILRIFTLLKFRKVKLANSMVVDDIDVTQLYEREIGRGYSNPAFVNNIIRYFIAKRIGGSLKFMTFVYTFENYAWEKMTILGLRESGAKGKILGFQHAFVSRNSFKYFVLQHNVVAIDVGCC